MKFFAEAASLHEAKRDMRKQIRDSWELIREEVLFDGTRQVTGRGETVEAAVEFARLGTNIPPEAIIVDSKTRPPGESRTEMVEAFDEEDAKAKLWEKFGGTVLIDSLSRETAGRKGFLGVGRARGRYVATVRDQAAATVTYKFARVSAFAFPRDIIGDTCCVCGIYIRPPDIRKAMGGSEENYVPCLCDGCGQWVCWWCALHLLAPAVVPTSQVEKIRSWLTVRDGKVWHQGCGGRVRTFKFLIVPKAPKSVAQPVCSSCAKTISEAELGPDKMGRLTEQIFPGLLGAKYGVTIGCAMKCDGCGEWICAGCAEKAALAAGVGALKHANCGGMFETIKP